MLFRSAICLRRPEPRRAFDPLLLLPPALDRITLTAWIGPPGVAEEKERRGLERGLGACGGGGGGGSRAVLAGYRGDWGVEVRWSIWLIRGPAEGSDLGDSSAQLQSFGEHK